MVIVTEPILLLRALKSSELACLLALTLAGEPVRVSWLGRVTGLSPHTLTSALNNLQALGLAQDDGQRSGWHLIASLQENLLARAEALPAAGECHGSSPPGAGSKQASFIHRRDTQNKEKGSFSPGGGSEAAHNSVTAPEYHLSGDRPVGANREPLNYRVANRAALKEEVEENTDSISPPDLDSRPVCRDMPLQELPEASPIQVERVLAATAGLFGGPCTARRGATPTCAACWQPSPTSTAAARGCASQPGWCTVC